MEKIKKPAAKLSVNAKVATNVKKGQSQTTQIEAVPKSRPNKPNEVHQARSPTPWEYTPKVTGETQIILPPKSETSSIFVDTDDTLAPDWEVADKLLDDANACSSLFTRRLLQQKLAEPMELLAPRTELTSLGTTIDTVQQFIVENPNLFLDLFGNTGYLCFPGLIRSEIFALLNALAKQKDLDLQQTVNYGPEEIQKLLVEVSQTSTWIDQSVQSLDAVVRAIGN